MNFRFFISDFSEHPVIRGFLDEQVGLSKKYQAYYCLRPVIPSGFRNFLQRHKKCEYSTEWYKPEKFINELTSLLKQMPSEKIFLNPWPDSAVFAFVLTHDVETEAGFQFIPEVAKMEEELGFRSSWNIVPYKYPVDAGLLEDLQQRGFEIGIHGYNHDGKLYFSKARFQKRAVKINEALKKYSAVGFRSPMFHRHLEWLQMLDLEYDSSCFDVDPFQPMPGGVGSVWPFIAGKFVELPCTMPQDHVLFYHLGLNNIDIWKNKLKFLIENRGLVLMLTHPDYLIEAHHLELYRQFLEYVKSFNNYWHALPLEVTNWWQEREKTRFFRDKIQGTWQIVGPAALKSSVMRVCAGQDKLIFEKIFSKGDVVVMNEYA